MFDSQLTSLLGYKLIPSDSSGKTEMVKLAVFSNNEATCMHLLLNISDSYLDIEIDI